MARCYLSNYGGNQLLAAALGTRERWVSLSPTTDPSAGQLGTRQSVHLGDASGQAVASRTNQAFLGLTPGASIAAFGVWSAATGGALLAVVLLDAPIVVDGTGALRLAPGDLALQVVGAGDLSTAAPLPIPPPGPVPPAPPPPPPEPPPLPPPPDPNPPPPPDPSVWHLAWFDDFLGNGRASLDSGYIFYHNPDPANPRGPKSDDLVLVRNSMLTLRVTQLNGVWTGSGINLKGVGVLSTYGKYEIRFRYGPGFGTKAVALTWPNDGTWPPEVDWLEFRADEASHNTLTLTNHYKPGNQMQHAPSLHGDWTQWHTVGLEWTPDALRYTLDGAVTATQTGQVPQKDMWMDLTNNLGRSAASKPNSSTPAVVDFDVDWVKFWTYHGP